MNRKRVGKTINESSKKCMQKYCSLDILSSSEAQEQSHADLRMNNFLASI